MYSHTNYSWKSIKKIKEVKVKLKNLVGFTVLLINVEGPTLKEFCHKMK